jgi:hypothetical protein
MLGFVVLMLLACFLLRRIFHAGGFCCAGEAGKRNADSNDPMRILKSRSAKGEIGRE